MTYTVSSGTLNSSIPYHTFTQSPFHSMLKTPLFHKSFPPQTASTNLTDFSDYTGSDSFCSTVFVF